MSTRLMNVWEAGFPSSDLLFWESCRDYMILRVFCDEGT